MEDVYKYPGAITDAAVLFDARQILVMTPIAIRGWDGFGEPELDLERGIRLNGDAAVEHDSETFHLLGAYDSGLAYPFEHSVCSTNGMPYAEVVTAILISAFVHQGAAFTSDGGWKSWQDGVRLFESAVRPLTLDELFTLELSAEGMLARPKPAPLELWPD